MNLLQYALALAQVFQILQKYAPLEQAALAAFKAGGVIGLLNYLKTLNVTAGQPGPSQAELSAATQQLSAAHA